MSEHERKCSWGPQPVASVPSEQGPQLFPIAKIILVQCNLDLFDYYLN